MSRDDDTHYRVTYAEVAKPLQPKDFEVIRGALLERGGFDGDVINEILSRLNIQETSLERLGSVVSSDQTISSLCSEDILSAFVLCCLTSAALGEEELSTILGNDQDEFYTTIRRLYHALRMSSKSHAGEK